MLVPIFGTTGELVKFAPVLRRLDERGLSYLSISTNQQVTQIPHFQSDLGLPPSNIELAHGRNGHDLEQKMDIPIWTFEVARGFMANRRQIRSQLASAPGRHVAMIHGDPLTAPYGALMGRALGLPVAHLEAGMRSHNWRNPFPEELDRRIAGAFATIHYANTDLEISNLKHARGEIVKIGANTVLDAIDMVPEGESAIKDILGDKAPEGRYALFSIHRTELLGNRERLKSILETVAEFKFDFPMYFIDHPVTVAALKSLGLDGNVAPFVRIPRQRYTAFITLLRGCEFLVTDSGGCQEECFYLDVPCLVHRLVTEREEGLGRNVVLSRYDLSAVRDFLRNPYAHKMGSRPHFPSPSDVVVEDLIRRGVWG